MHTKFGKLSVTGDFPMRRVFVHRYKWSHRDKRKKYKKLLKLGNVVILETAKDGWVYGIPIKLIN